MATARPCTCDRPGCRLCHLAATHHGYRRLWGLAAAEQSPDQDAGREYTRINEPPEAQRRKAICRLCAERPDGCWRNYHMGCETKQRAVERHAVNFGRCPAGKWEPPVAVVPLPPGACPACLVDDPIPEPDKALSKQQQYAWANQPAVKDKHIKAFAAMLARDFSPPQTLAGDGILTCGAGKYWPGIVVMVRLLREVGCGLPVQVWYDGPIGRELDGAPRVTLHSIHEHGRLHPWRVMRGWETKTYSILHSGLRRIFFIDADAYFVADPTAAFAELDRQPFVYWRDLHAQDWRIRWAAIGVDGQHVPPVQGGHLLIDLHQAWRFTTVAHWLNQHSDYFYGQNGFGDQDTWRMVLAAGFPYECIGLANWRRLAYVCDYRGQPLIVHRAAPRAKLFPSREPAAWHGLPREARVLELYRELVDPVPPEAPGQRIARLRSVRRRHLARMGLARGYRQDSV